MTSEQQQKIEAAVFNRLVDLLQKRTDVQNIDIMGTAGFCRNCFSKWYVEAAADIGLEVDKTTAQEKIYGMPYDDYKAKHQTPASDEQMAKMNASVAKNKEVGA